MAHASHAVYFSTAFAKPILVPMHSTLEMYVHHQKPFIVPVFFTKHRFDDVFVLCIHSKLTENSFQWSLEVICINIKCDLHDLQNSSCLVTLGIQRTWRSTQETWWSGGGSLPPTSLASPPGWCRSRTRCPRKSCQGGSTVGHLLLQVFSSLC